LKRFNRSHGHPSLAPRAQHAIKFGPGEEFLGSVTWGTGKLAVIVAKSEETRRVETRQGVQDPV
jgi:hypothetical protein